MHFELIVKHLYLQWLFWKRILYNSLIINGNLNKPFLTILCTDATKLYMLTLALVQDGVDLKLRLYLERCSHRQAQAGGRIYHTHLSS